MFSWGGNLIESALCSNQRLLRFLGAGTGARRTSILLALPAAVGNLGAAGGALFAAQVAAVLQRGSWLASWSLSMPAAAGGSVGLGKQGHTGPPSGALTGAVAVCGYQ